MKRVIITLLFVVGLTLPSMGQMDTVSGPDGRVEGWHGMFWYDTCPEYRDTARVRFHIGGMTGGLREWSMLAQPHYVHHPSAVIGASVLIDPYPDHGNAYLDSVSKMPEYVYVVQKGVDTMIFLDRTRWDTAECKVLKLPLNIDSARFGFSYCHVYTAYFDKPVEVDSIFYMCGTHKSNDVEYNMDLHRHTSYCYITQKSWSGDRDCGMPYPTLIYSDSTNPTPMWRNLWSPINSYGINRLRGFIIPIMDMVEMRVESADSTMGTAGPSGGMSANTWQTIWAHAVSGYRFKCWNDGDTSNPRQVRLMSDTMFTAYFGIAEQHTVRVSSNTTLGHVEGGGIYYWGDTAVLTAVPDVVNYTFVRWNDSVTDNPRSVEVLRDTSFTAYFVRNVVQGITEESAEGSHFSLVPNPAHGKVRIVVDGMPQAAKVSMYDMKGREVWSCTVDGRSFEQVVDVSSCTSGVYFVTLTTERNKVVKRLIIGE